MAEYVIDITNEELYNIAKYYDRPNECKVSIYNVFQKIKNGRWLIERKQGKWLVKDNGSGGKYVECPFCGALAPCTEFADRTVWKYSKFCYDCGNELRGNENE